MGVSAGFTPFVPTHPRDEGMVIETWGFIGAKDLLSEGKESEINETRGFIGAKDLLSEGKESETDFGCKILFVGANVG